MPIPGKTVLQQTINALPEGCILKSTFIQKRHLKDIPHALTSSGEIILWSGKGLIWRTTTPFPSAVLMTKKGLYQLDQNKKTSLTKQQKSANEGVLFDILSKVLNGSFDDLAGFKVHGLKLKPGKGAPWCVDLTPPAAVQKVITSLEITGHGIGKDRYISGITIKRPNGDHDEITLEKPQIYSKQDQGKALTSQEMNWLND
jgi:hypothetical protein